MKPTQITELFANIKKTFVSFFSILMFVALGVGIFLGISWAGPALENASDKEFDKGSFHHFQIQYSYGFTDDDIEKLSAIEGVTDIERARMSFQTIDLPGESNLSVRVQSLTERIDVPVVLEGTLPSKPDEIALNKVAADKLGYAVGDTVTFNKDADDNSGMELDLSSLGATAGNAGAQAAGNASQAAADGAQAAGSADAQSGKPADKDGMTYLNGSTFTVTALVRSPEYIANDSDTYGFSTTPSGAVNLLSWVVPEAFDASAFRDGYPIVDILCDSLVALHTFSSEYSERSAEIEERISPMAEGFAEARFEKLHGDAQQKIDEADKQLNEGKKKIIDGEKQIEEGRAQLEQKKNEGLAKLQSGYDELQRLEGVRQEGEAKLNDARDMIIIGQKAIASAENAKAQLDSAISYYESLGNAAKAKYDASGKTAGDKAAYDAELDSIGATAIGDLQQYANMVNVTIPAIDHTNFFKVVGEARSIVDRFENLSVTYEGQTISLAQARAKLAEAEQKYNDGLAEYNSRVAQLNEGWATYNAGVEELNRLVAEGEKKIADGEAEVADAKKKVEENEPKIEQAKEKLAAMKKGKSAIMSRSYNAGAVEISTFSNVTNNLSFSMAALFIIVGLLVSYSAVSRIVHEQITQIGTKKALGLRSREITASFLAYSGIAVVTGAIVGTIVGIIVVEGIIGHTLGGMFTFGDYPPYFGLPLFLVVTLAELVLVLGATYLACRGILKEHAVELLRGEKPPQGKTRFYEKWALWDKMPLLTQTIVNNCINDKRRVFSTIVGVAGCTALIVTAITLNNDVMKSYDAHYSDVYGFNAIAFVDSQVDGAADKVQSALEDAGMQSEPVTRKSFILTQPDGKRGTVRVIAPKDSSAFADLYHVNPVSGKPLDLSAEGVWISQAYAEHFGAKVGDKVVFEDTDGAAHEAVIAGIDEFWLTYHEMVMGHDYYKSLFGVDPVANIVLVNTLDKKVDDAGALLADIKGFDSITDDKTHQYSNFETFSSVSSAVVLIYIILSVLMAIVVLLNLNVMFIDEKKRELIVLMINGFSVKDAKRYIYNDTIVLTAIGIVLGIILGCIMGSTTVASIEPSTASFIKSVDWIAVLVGAVGSAALAFIMSVIALRRIPRFNLTDINKF